MSVGVRLRHARLEKNMTLEQVAECTKIPLSSLECMENGRFSELPNETVIRGFIRSVCQVLCLDDVEILREYASAGARTRLEAHRSLGRDLNGMAIKPKASRVRFLLALLVFLILASLLFLVVFTPSNLKGSDQLSGSVDHAMNPEK